MPRASGGSVPFGTRAGLSYLPGMADFIIRRARIDDADGIGEVLAECWKWAYAGILTEEQIAPQADKAARAQRVRDRWNPSTAYVVAVDSAGEVLGFAVEGGSSRRGGLRRRDRGLVRPSPRDPKRHRSSARRVYDRFVFGSRLPAAVHPHAARQPHWPLLLRKDWRRLCAEDFWNSIPAVWYGWDDLEDLRLKSGTGILPVE